MVRTKFDRSKHYPLAARKRGWEGDVVLGFRIEPDGHINEIRIHRGSGFRILDESAAETLRHVTLTDTPNILPEKEGVNLELFVTYSLIDAG